MSTLTDLLRQVGRLDPQLADDLRAEVQVLSQRRPFGLNFERHVPEAVDLPGRPVRRGDTVRLLPPRTAPTDTVERGLWTVASVDADLATLVRPGAAADAAPMTWSVSDLVAVARFRDPVFPGLISTGSVSRGDEDRPWHSVINAENFHALEALAYTHAGAIDAIYIDPPYNTGARDWKYNNDYVDTDDAYRHSKWLAMMERRLELAKRLLNPDDSVLIVAIDEREGRRLGLLLEQLFSDCTVQMVSTVINPKGVPKAREFSRVDEWLFFVMRGSAGPGRWVSDMISEQPPRSSVRYVNLKREGSNWQRATRPSLFYPIYVDPDTANVVEFGEPLDPTEERVLCPDRPGLLTCWPLRPDGAEARWQQSPGSARSLLAKGMLRSRFAIGGAVIFEYLSRGQEESIRNGSLRVTGRDANGALVVEVGTGLTQLPKTVWRQTSHSATEHGSKLLTSLIGGRNFAFPKSLYAVEDALRFFVADKPDATILDFFAGSGTTAHAVMRLNKQDGGRRRSISISNNEVSAEEAKRLRAQGLRPGDPDWERWGICDHITKPRIRAAVTGRTPEGEPIKGDYKFTDEFAMSDGFAENVEFFTLTYESPRQVAFHRAFERIAPLLWLRAGACGRRIDFATDDFDIAESYAVLFDLDATGRFLDELATTLEEGGPIRLVFVVTDDDRAYQVVCAELPARTEPVRLYSSYLTTFTIGGGGT